MDRLMKKEYHISPLERQRMEERREERRMIAAPVQSPPEEQMKPGTKRQVLSEEEEKRLLEARLDVFGEMPTKLPGIHDEDREGPADLRLNGIYGEWERLKKANEKRVTSKKKKPPEGVAVSPLAIWKGVAEDYIDTDAWTPEEKAVFQRLSEAMAADCEALTHIADPVAGFEAEQRLHRILVELPRTRKSGTVYFTKLMMGEAREGELAGFGILEENSRVVSFLDSFKDRPKEEILKLGEALAGLLLLFGERAEPSYLTRDGLFHREMTERKRKKRVMNRLRRERMQTPEAYLRYLSKETEKLKIPSEYL